MRQYGYSITSSARASSVGGIKAERLGGCKVEDQLNFGGLLDRQIGRLLALENPTSIDAGDAERISTTGSVAQ